MQTFLPLPSFRDSASALDQQRLGKQRVEAYQILRALWGLSSGWVHHPATRMWRGHTNALAWYGQIVCREWIDRGHRDTLLPKISAFRTSRFVQYPPWFGDDAFHLSHRSNLVRKLPDHYGPLFPDAPDDLPYVWPV